MTVFREFVLSSFVCRESTIEGQLPRNGDGSVLLFGMTQVLLFFRWEDDSGVNADLTFGRLCAIEALLRQKLRRGRRDGSGNRGCATLRAVRKKYRSCSNVP